MSAVGLAFREACDRIDGPEGRWIVMAVLAVVTVLVLSLDVHARRRSR